MQVASSPWSGEDPSYAGLPKTPRSTFAWNAGAVLAAQGKITRTFGRC